jgi:hypothetical protein
MRTVWRLLIAAAVFFFTVQALYWPLIMKPGTELHWWQLEWAARSGYFIGAPVVGAILIAPFTGPVQDLLAIALALLWSLVIYWILGAVTKRRFVQGERNAT